MEDTKIKIEILPNQFLKTNGKFDKEQALNLCGKIAGVCYDEEGFNHLKDEPVEKTNRRINLTLNNGHHSVYDHVMISFNLQNVSKILAMFLNNEHQYTTSEKSARYTPIVKKPGSIITETEEKLYNKWIQVFKTRIKLEYGNIFNDSKIQKLAQENARYLVTVFMPTDMIYTTTLRQINYIASWMNEFINNYRIIANNLYDKLVYNMQEFLDELDKVGVLVPELMENEKARKLSLIGKNLENKKEYFGDIYTTTYKGTYAQLAQAQRHRTLDYQMELLTIPEYFIPPIIANDQLLVYEWISDMQKVSSVMPQGEMVRINESGKYEDFILKCKERLCSAAQLEIMEQTKEILLKYKKALEESQNPLAKDIEKYNNGARCTFPGFYCKNKCNFKDGIQLTRKI